MTIEEKITASRELKIVVSAREGRKKPLRVIEKKSELIVPIRKKNSGAQEEQRVNCSGVPKKNLLVNTNYPIPH
jgi:hypothetical protein